MAFNRSGARSQNSFAGSNSRSEGSGYSHIDLSGPSVESPGRAKGKITIDRRPYPAKLTGPLPVLPLANKKDPLRPLPFITTRELDRGILSCIDRGLIPGSTDVTSALDGLTGPHPLVASAATPQAATPGSRKSRRYFEPGPIHATATRVDRAETPTQWPANHPLSPTYHPTPSKQGISFDEKDEAFRESWKIRQEMRLKKTKYTDSVKATKDFSFGTAAVEDPALDHQLKEEWEKLQGLVIRRGRTLDTTLDFLDFQQRNSHRWGAIVSLLRAIERLCEEYAVPMVYLDPKELQSLADIDLEVPEREVLLMCLRNKEEVQYLISKPGQRFRVGTKGFDAAATTIQSLARMFLTRLAYLRLKHDTGAAHTIQSAWSIFCAHLATRTIIRSQIRQSETAWQQIMENFIKDWPTIRQNPRLIIHIPSLSYIQEQCVTTPFFNCFQNAQMASRLCDLADPNVSVLFVSPYPVERAVVQYYVKLMHASGIRGVEDRLTILYPENFNRLPRGVSLTKAILWSPKLMKEIRVQMEDTVSYIVPCVVGPEELRLASQLKIPLLGPQPQVAQALMTTSGTKQIFEDAQVVTPIGAYDLFDDIELLKILSQLVVTYLEYPRWLIKMDHEVKGRGIVYLDVHRLKEMQNVDWSMADLDFVRDNVQAELREFGPKRFKIVNSMLYPTWTSFLRDFRKFGGVIEAVPGDCVASPVINAFIHPNGEVEVMSSQEQVLSPQYCCMGAYYPQSAVSLDAVATAVQAVGKACYNKSIMGYITVDFVVYQSEGQLMLWAVDLNIHLTDNAGIHQLIQLVCKKSPGLASDPDPKNEKDKPEDSDSDPGAMVPTKVPQRQPGDMDCSYVYSGIIYHPSISSIQHATFFQLCTSKGLSFHFGSRAGILFHLVDSLSKGCLGVICVGTNPKDSLARFTAAVDFLQQHLNNTNVDDNQTNFHHVSAACRALSQNTSQTIVPLHKEVHVEKKKVNDNSWA